MLNLDGVFSAVKITPSPTKRKTVLVGPNAVSNLIRYKPNKSYFECGHVNGKLIRQAGIQEVAE